MHIQGLRLSPQDFSKELRSAELGKQRERKSFDPNVLWSFKQTFSGYWWRHWKGRWTLRLLRERGASHGLEMAAVPHSPGHCDMTPQPASNTGGSHLHRRDQSI